MAQAAPRITVYEDGSLGNDGSLESDASVLIDAALNRVVTTLQPAGLETHALPPRAMEAASDAVSLAQLALAEPEITKKMVLAAAASQMATFFGLPRNTLAYSLDQVFGMFAMSASQRRAIHQQAAAALDLFVATKKGSPMSGVYKDGVLGMTTMFQNTAFRDGSLGASIMFQNGAFQDGSLGRVGRRRGLRGLGGGCGCSGMGADAVLATEQPFYKKPAVIAVAAAVGLGVVLFAVKRK